MKVRGAWVTIENGRISIEPMQGGRIFVAPIGSMSAHLQAFAIQSGDPELDRVASIQLDPSLMHLLDERTRRRLRVLISFGGEIDAGRVIVPRDRLPDDVEETRVIELLAELVSHLASPEDDAAGALSIAEGSGELSAPEE